MPSFKLGLGVLLGVFLGFVGASPASAAQSAAHCEDLLTELGSTQAALARMEEALDANATRSEELRIESATPAARISDERRAGATDPEIASLVQQRQDALDELATHQKLRPALQLQRDALVDEVDTAQRGYISCVEATL